MNNRLKAYYLISFLIIQTALVQKSFCQTDSTQKINLFLPQNILLFADYLFCQKDYLRAITEYEHYLSFKNNDTVKFKIAISFLNMNNYSEAKSRFAELKQSPVFSNAVQLKTAQTIFQSKDFTGLEKFYNQAETNHYSNNEIIKSLYYYTLLYKDSHLPNETDFINVFPPSIRLNIKKYYSDKENLPYRSPVLAAILSSIIPGAGKIYTGNYSDGVTSTILTGLLAFISYDNFKAKHNFRGWLWGGLSAFFYAGNIYGSAASAQIFNAKVSFDLTTELDLFIKNNNYFLPEDDFNCK
jgi:TM2 domain-containing membrane protein YozV